MDYVEQLLAEAQLDSAGQITLDPEKARLKLSRHALMSFDEGMLALISALILGGAEHLRLEHQGWRWRLAGVGPGPTPELARRLLQAPLHPDLSLELRELGVALNSLVPQHCSQLEIDWPHCRALYYSDGWRVDPSAGVLGGGAQPPLDRYGAGVLGGGAQPPLDRYGAGVLGGGAQPPLGGGGLSGWEIRLTQGRSDWRAWLSRMVSWRTATGLTTIGRRTLWSPVPVLFRRGQEWLSYYELEPPQAPAASLALLSVTGSCPSLHLPEIQAPLEVPRWSRTTRSRSSLRVAVLPGDPARSTLFLVQRGITLMQLPLQSNIVRFWGVLSSEGVLLDLTRRRLVNWRLQQQLHSLALQWVHQACLTWLEQKCSFPLPAPLQQLHLQLRAAQGVESWRPMIEHTRLRSSESNSPMMAKRRML